MLAACFVGCATRMVRKPLIDRTGIQVDLVREVSGFTTQPQGFEHPAVISSSRLEHILNAVEVETRGSGAAMTRQPAFHPGIVERTAEAMADALGKAGTDQEIGVQVVRKESKLGLFNRKFLTSFLAHVDDGHLYLYLQRIEWPIPQKDAKRKLPKPRRGYNPMDFRVIGGEHLYYFGPHTLEIDWQNPVFQTAYQLPGSTDGQTRRREVLERAPIPKDELEAEGTSGALLSVDEMTAEQLRALAQLGEDRGEGRITEAEYQRSKRQLLRRRTDR